MNKLFRVLIVLCVLFQSFASPLLQGWKPNVYAGREQNDVAGYARTDFLTNLAGISSGANYVHNPVSPGTVMSDGNPAMIITSEANPTSFSAWNTLTVVYSGSAPEYQIMNCSDVLLDALPLPYGGPVNLNTAPYATETCLKAKVLFNPGTDIDDITLSWEPETVVLLDLGVLSGGVVSQTATVTAGECVTYQVRWSASYYDNPDTALYVQLPYLSGDAVLNTGFATGTITQSYNQFPFSNLQVPFISDNGFWNSGDVSISLPGGLVVPPKSVYRQPDSGDLGSTHLYTFQLCTDRGTQTGVNYTMVAGIQGEATSVQLSNPVSTTIRSTPQPTVSCLSDKAYLIQMINESKVVNYTYQVSHLDTSTEDLFTPVVSLNYTDIVTDMVTSCGIDAATARSKITVPTGFGAIDAITNTTTITNSILYTPNPYYGLNGQAVYLYPQQSATGYTYTGSIDYGGCGLSTFSGRVIVGVQAANYAIAKTGHCDITSYTIPPSNATLGDFVWYDENSDGLQGATESGVSGVQVELRLCDTNPAISGQVYLTGMTDGSGRYLFENLPAPTLYQVWFQLPNPNSSGYRWTTQTVSTASGSDVNSAGKTSCFTLAANEDKRDIDAGMYIPAASTGVASIDGWYNKCMFTNTSDENRFNSALNATQHTTDIPGSLLRETNREGIMTNQIGFYDNDCLDTYGANDRNSHSTYVEVNANNPTTFYHLNYHGDLPVVAQLYAKQGVWSVDRINELYSIDGVDIWTNEGTTLNNMQWSEDNASSRASRWCHSDTGMVMPAVNTVYLDGTIIPTAGDLGTGWSTTCDGNSRWVLSYMQCIDSLYAPSQPGTACAGAPSRYQFRINVTPTESPDLMCTASATTSVAIPNASYVYMTKNNNGSGGDTIFLYNTGAGGYVGTADQQSYITKTSPDLLLTGGSIFHQVYGPSILSAGSTGTYIYVRQNYSPIHASGAFTIAIPLVDGICPEVTNVSTGFIFDAVTCSIQGLIDSIAQSGSGAVSCQDNPTYKQLNTYSMNDTNTETSYGYQWNGTQFDNSRYQQALYNSSGERVGYYGYSRNGSAWELSDKQIYDSHDSWLHDGGYESLWYAGGIIDGGDKRIVFKDSNGNTLAEEYSIWDQGTNAWQKNSKQEYTYDAQGRQISSVSYTWDIAMNTRKYQSKRESEYDSNGNGILYMNYEWSSATNVWVHKQTQENSYTLDNKVATSTNANWNSSLSSVVNNNRIEYTYDSNGNQSTYTSQGWNTTTNMWVNSQFYQYTYNANNKQILSLRLTRNTLANVWVNSSKTETTYDINSNPLVSYSYTRNSTINMWVDNSKSESIYDNNGRLLRRANYIWNTTANAWRSGNAYEYTYDSSGRQLSYTYFQSSCQTTPSADSASQSKVIAWDIFASSGSVGSIIHTGSYTLSSVCNALSGSATKTTTVQTVSYTLNTEAPEAPQITSPSNATPDLITHKYLDREIISSSGEITYTIKITNTGEGLAEEIFITDMLPEGTELVSVTTSGGTIPLSTNGQSYNLQTISGGSYTCPGYDGQFCGVYFSAAGITPSVITASTGYSATYILNNFTLGTEVSGIWSPEAPVIIEDVRYVSVRIPALAPGDHAIIQIKVRNTINLRGDVIRNIAATIAKNLLQSLSNTVYTTLLPFEPNTIAGVVYHDENRSYSNTTGENVFSGVTVWLYSGADLMGTQVTNNEGEYLFDGLQDGIYRVVYDPTTVPGYMSFVSNTGTVDGTPVGATSGLTTITTIELAGGDESIENNFGLVLLNTIAGVVYHDANRNFSNTTGEGLFSGATVTLYSGTTVIATTTTNSSGAYLFTGLVNGTYTVTYDPTTVPGYIAFTVNTGTVNGMPIGIASGLTTMTTITLLGGDESIQNNFGLVQVTPGGGGSSSVGGTSGGGSSGGGTSGGTPPPAPPSNPTTNPTNTQPESNEESDPEPQEETVITLPFKFLQPKEFLPTGIKDVYDDLLKTKGWNTYVNDKNITTSAPAWFVPGRDEEAGKALSYWESIVPQTEWTQYYLPAEAILAIPSQGIIVPVNYPKEDGLTDPNDEGGHLKYLDYGAVQRAGSAYLGSDAGPILIEGHSASLVTNNAGPFGAVMKSTVLVEEGALIYAFVKGNAGYTQYTYKVTKKTQVNPDNTDVLNNEKSGSLFISACGDDKQVGTLKARNILVAELVGEAGVEMDTIIKAPIVYDEEIKEAYTWAKEEGVTTQPTINDARMFDTLTRGELAKMMVEWRKGTSEGSGEETEGNEGSVGSGCTAETYGDYASADAETQQFMFEACTMGLMGRDGQGGTTKTFRWADGVSRAEFGTVLSRALRGTQYDRGGENWYAGHLEALKAAGIMTKIDTPMMQEVRGYVMIMLMRVQ